MNYWKEYWSNKVDGGHRSNSEYFISTEAKEKLFHLGNGKTLLDFGCGAAELLIYYSHNFEHIVGVDFSEQMLKNAEKRIIKEQIHNISLIYADDKTVWNKLDFKFDKITAGQVVQYLNNEQLERFIDNAVSNLNANGRIILFDVIHPNMYYMWKAGLFTQKSKMNKMAKMAKYLMKISFNILRKKPLHEMGNGFHPNFLYAIANKLNLDCEIIYSMYYEYRYHAIIKPRENVFKY